MDHILPVSSLRMQLRLITVIQILVILFHTVYLQHPLLSETAQI